jgi:DNA-directed RNA polymerase specialized sigma24 family protein
VPETPDRELHALLRADPARGWRRFVDEYTPWLVSIIERAGVRDPDDVSDVYVRVCDRLAADRCARLRAHDPAHGALAAWLTTIVKHVVVDWIRSRAGRRRLFGAVEHLDERDRAVFELFYWDGRPASEIAEILRSRQSAAITVADVLDALARIDAVLTDRHRAQLAAFTARTRPHVSLDDLPVAPASGGDGAPADPEQRLRAKETDTVLRAALATLTSEEAAIVRLLYVQGWSRDDVRRALHLPELTAARVRSILATLRARLAERAVSLSDLSTPGLTFLEDGGR